MQIINEKIEKYLQKDVIAASVQNKKKNGEKVRKGWKETARLMPLGHGSFRRADS